MLRPINRMTWQEIAELDRSRLAYVLPISSTEQHGRQLPVGTDDLILQTSLEAVAKELTTQTLFLQLPAIAYGNSFEHLDFPGTMTLRTDTMMRILEDLLYCMQQHQVRYLVIINSHGGNTPIFRAMSQEWKQRFQIEIFHVDYFGSDFFAGSQPIFQTPVAQDIHAGEIETSYLQAVLPEVVKTQWIGPEWDVLVQLEDYDDGWTTQKLSPGNGMLGAASCANEQKGERLRSYMVQKLQKYLERIDQRIREEAP